MKQNDPLRDSLDKLKIQYNDEQIEQFRSYYELLTEWNKKINLTAITGYEDVVRKHFIDSILICSLLDLNKDIRIIDVGTGAGFPGIPIKILNPDCRIVLLDSLNKRVGFISEVINELGLEDIKAFHGRSEDYGKEKSVREQYDICVHSGRSHGRSQFRVGRYFNPFRTGILCF